MRESLGQPAAPSGESVHHPSFPYRTAVLVAISLLAVLGMSLIAPIAQDPGYHRFADTRVFAGIVNFANVLSNLPFLLVGGYGLMRRGRLLVPSQALAYTVLCLGAVLVGFGSAYYHLAPSNDSLIWDRLPMTVAFMALFSLVLEERLLPDARSRTLWPLLAVGIGAALYWYWSESRGVGDLRPYALVQFLPMLLIPLLLWLFPQRYLRSARVWQALALYALAKLFEQFDGQVLQSTGISGHSFKHLSAAAAMLCLILATPIARAETAH